MSCNCKDANLIPYNSKNLKLGVTNAGFALNVYFKTASGRPDIYPGASDSDGNITMACPQLRLNTIYEISMALVSDAKQQPIIWTISGTNVSCIYVEFHQEFSSDVLYAPDPFEITLKS